MNTSTLTQQYSLASSLSRRQPGCASTPKARHYGTQRQQRQFHHKRASRRVTTMGLFGLGLPEVAVVAGIAVLVFGPSKLPELGKELGKTVKSFQTAAKEFETELKNAADDTADNVEETANKLKDEAKK